MGYYQSSMLKYKFILGFVSRIFVQMLQLVATIFIARIAGPSVLGTIAFGMAFVDMFSFIGSLGLGSAHTKLINEGENIDDCTTTYAILHIITKFIFFITVLTYFILQKYVFHFPFESREHEYVIIISMVTVLINTMIDIPVSNFAARMEQAKSDIPEMFRNIFLAPSRIITVIVGGAAVALAFVNFLSYLIIIPFYWYLFFKTYHFGKFSFPLAGKYFRYGIPLIVLSLSVSFSNTLDKVLLQYFTNSEMVGIYTAGFRIGGYFLLIGQSAGLIFFPLFSKAVSEHNIQMIDDAIARYHRFVFLFVMPVMILLALLSSPIVSIMLGEKYYQSIPVLTIITIAQLIYLVHIPYGNLISGMGKFRLAALINIINVLVISLALLMLVHPAFAGLASKGAAWSFLISNIFLAACFVYYAKKFAPGIQLKTYFRFLLIGIILFVGFYYSYCWWVGSKTLHQIIFVFLYFTVVYSIFNYSGIMRNSDWKYLLSLGRMDELFKYVRSEIFYRKKEEQKH